jgi:hypothetical protein
MKRSLSEIEPTTTGALPRHGGGVRPLGLTRRQKRLLVGGRLVEPDARGLSDRAIARELGVSQPFVSAIRRTAGQRQAPRRPSASGGLGMGAASVAASSASNERWLNETSAECSRPTSAQQWLDRNHDECSPLGRVRRVAWPASWDELPAATSGDPYERG